MKNNFGLNSPYIFNISIATVFILIFVTFSFSSISPFVSKNVTAESETVEVQGQTPKVDVSKVEAPKVELVPYSEKIEHIFFHPLIAYPEKAFDGDYIAQGFDDWFVTVSEFNKILESLYKNNYILVDIRAAFEKKNEEGKEILVRKELMLPKGKKPLVISIDDVNYYQYMWENGTINKLVIDSNNKVAALTLLKDGEQSIRYDNEIIPILDKFVETHNDFSLNGAKGILALTGYSGVLGYNTHILDSPDYQREKEQAQKVVSRLKETGWMFASHSYCHYDLKKISLGKLQYDTDKWEKEVASIIGSTELYIYPFGSGVNNDKEKLKILLNGGFKMFFGVGGLYQKLENDHAFMDRFHIDGIYFRDHLDSPSQFLNVRDVLDTARGWTLSKINTADKN